MDGCGRRKEKTRRPPTIREAMFFGVRSNDDDAMIVEEANSCERGMRRANQDNHFNMTVTDLINCVDINSPS